MILVINMDAAGEHRYRLTPIICHLFYIYFVETYHQKGHSTVDWARWRHNTAARAPRLGLALSPALAKDGPIYAGALAFKLNATVCWCKWVNNTGHAQPTWLAIGSKIARKLYVNRGFKNWNRTHFTLFSLGNETNVSSVQTFDHLPMHVGLHAHRLLSVAKRMLQ